MGVSRKFVDSFGFAWQVWEIVPEAAATGRVAVDATPGWLYFFSRGTTRRLRSYPVDWYSQNWVDLEDLCSRAEVLGAERVTWLVRPFADRELPLAVPAGAGAT